tara:strand:- start:2968 stop:3237 length:270 start_codon:yes stop_codon:yes gene_type:complete
MPTIEDHSFLKICAQLASCLSISLAAARRKVDLAAANQGVRSLEERKLIAENLLKQALFNSKDSKKCSSSELDNLLTALAEDENFMIED